MIKSMTGFGKVTAELPSKKVIVEIKALNSKQFDLSTRVPSVFKEKEIELRNRLLQHLERGKIDFTIYVEYIGKETPTQLNAAAIESYCLQIREVSKKTGIPLPGDWFALLVRLPNVVCTEVQEADEAEWSVVSDSVDKAIRQLIAFREQEGAMLDKLFEEKVANISSLLVELEKYEGERLERVKSRILENLEKVGGMDFDKSRFEQEMIYYIEKLDINEEKSRLDHHLKYFINTMQEEGSSGKKLGFISQEMGREINTLGSKSNHVEIQKIVVRMKDELEQIKEQILNVL